MAQKITPSKIVKHARELIIKGIESGDNSFVIFDVDGALERLEHYRCQLKSFFPNSSIAYSYKSNNLAQWCQIISGKGLYAEVCSVDEMNLAKRDGFKRIVFDGPLKKTSELLKAIEIGALIEVDNIDECKRLNELCKLHKLTCRIHLRLSHYYDDNLSRFGLSESEAINLLEMLISKSEYLILDGFHLHVGSNLPNAEKICKAIIQYHELILRYMPDDGTLNLGSGIPADSFSASSDNPTPCPEVFFSSIYDTIKNCFGTECDKWNYIFEPGRHLVEDFGYFIGKVISTKNRYGVKVAQTNIGINWIPSIRNWDHSFTLFHNHNHISDDKSDEYIIAGFNCFECDCLFPSVILPSNLSDYLFSVRGCGAYDMQTGNQWTRNLYAVYTITNDVVNISRIHRRELDFRKYDVFLTPSEIKVNNEITLLYPALKYAEELYLLINQNKMNFIKSMAWPAFVNNISDSVSFIEQSMIDNQNEKALILFIKYKTKIAGVVSFNIIDHANKTAYIGYWLGANFQGKGIVTNAINKLIQEYGDSGVIKRFVIKCIIDNKKSNATALRCGFILEGVLQKAEILNGVSYDQNIYSKVIG